MSDDNLDGAQMVPPLPEPEAEAVVKKPWSRLKLALLASLAVNLLVVGLVVGAMAHRFRDPDMMQARALADSGFGPYIGALEPEGRRDLAKAIMGKAEDFRANRGALKAEFKAMAELLRADVLDVEAFRASLVRQSALLEARRALGIDALVNHVAGLEAPARERLAERLEHVMGRR